MRISKHSLSAFLAAFCLTIAACSEVPSEVDQNSAVATAKADQILKDAAAAQPAQPPSVYLGPSQALQEGEDAEVDLPEIFNKSYNLMSPTPMTIGDIAANLQRSEERRVGEQGR